LNLASFASNSASLNKGSPVAELIGIRPGRITATAMASWSLTRPPPLRAIDATGLNREERGGIWELLVKAILLWLMGRF
jgi:hypothetical protein